MSEKLSGKVVSEYLVKWPNMATMTLARKIHNENPELFTNVENVRSLIRYRRGTLGSFNRAKHKIEEVTYAEQANMNNIPNPFHLPDSDETEWEPFILPKLAKKVLILSDIHVPYHNIKAITLAIQYAKERKPDAIVFNGDTLDMYALSRYEKDPRKRSFSQELEACRQLLGVFKNEFPGIPFYWKQGNHEERYESFLRIKAPELLDVSEFRLDVLLRFGEIGCTLIADKRKIMAGKLPIMHGHEFGRSVFSPVNPARGYYMRAKTSVIAGHNHQTSEHSESNLHGEVVTTWSTGCLCELHPLYMPVNKWNHGFAFVTVDEDGGYEVDNVRIVKGKIR